jgi:hypothetical protein
MAFTLSEFRSQMVGDGARPNLFEVTLNFPLAVVGGLNAATKAKFMCRAAQLPGSTVNQIPVMYFGRELKFAGNRTFPDWTVTVINDEDFAVRNAFEAWMSLLNSHAGNVRNGAYVRTLDYTTDAYITQWGKTGEQALRQYRFVGAFPIDISPIELDWGANDTIEEYAITFAYQWWEDVQGATTDNS